MSRPISAEVLAAITSANVKPALFVEAYFASGPINVWSGIGAITWNAKTWTGLGSLGSIATVEEGATVEARGISLALSGIDPTILTGVVSEFRVGLPLRVWLGFFDAANALIPTPIASFVGRTDQPTLTMDGQSASIAINCENRLIDLNNSAERRYTNEDQQLDYPNDRGFEFVNSIQDTQLYWGRVPSYVGPQVYNI